MGFNVVHESDRTFVRHSGGCPGYYTEFRLEPKSKIGVIVLTNAIGSDVRTYTAQAFSLIAPEIKKATDAKESAPVRDPNLDRYVGVYDSIWGQTAVVLWGEGLAMLWLRTGDPKESLVELKHTGENTFRRIRKHEQGLGESIVFDVAENGIVRRFKQHSNWNIKVR